MAWLRSLGLTALFASLSLAVPTEVSKATSSPYPFNHIVAFGDELSDNGSGSFAHGITGNPASVYGNDTWTNGPVAITYLANSLRVSLTDYAFGGCCGGAKFGATLDNTYTLSEAGAQSLVQQIHNYTSHGSKDIKHSLQFIWVGQNDLTKHTDAYWLGDPNNAFFAANISTRLAASVKTLLKAGAPYVMVANIYPKQLSPVTPKYLCVNNSACVTTWGEVICQANEAIKSSVAQFGDKVIYFDAYSSVTSLLARREKLGFTRPVGNICDGQGAANWKDCMIDGNAGKYFWMNFVQPTTRVHAYIAADMKAAIDAHFKK